MQFITEILPPTTASGYRNGNNLSSPPHFQRAILIRGKPLFDRFAPI
jgi:hypothetical protein